MQVNKRSVFWTCLMLILAAGCSQQKPQILQPIQRFIDPGLKADVWHWESDTDTKDKTSPKESGIFELTFQNVKRNAIVLGNRYVHEHSIQDPESGILEFWGIGVDISQGDRFDHVQLKVSARSDQVDVTQFFELQVTRTPDSPWVRYEMPLEKMKGIVTVSFEMISEENSLYTDHFYAVVGSPVFLPHRQIDLPCIVMICFDSLRSDELGVYGSPEALTPTIDRISRNGLTFTQALSSSSWTVPAMKNLLSGRYTYLDQAEADSMLDVKPFKRKMIQEVCAQNGYYTMAVISNPLITPRIGFDEGFDLFDMQAVETYMEGSSLDIYQRTRYALENHPDRPIFLYVHVMDPHDPHTPMKSFRNITNPPPDREVREFLRKTMTGFLNLEPHRTNLIPLTDKEEQYIRQLYRAETRQVDAILHLMYESLLQQGCRASNTLMIVTADHGEEFGEFGFYQHGMSLYEASVRVPWIMVSPGTIPTKQLETGWVSTIDIPPTICAFVGMDKHESWEGYNAFPRTSGYPDPRKVFTAVRTIDDLKVPRLRWRSIYEGNRKLMWNPEAVMGFDLDRNPHEKVSFQYPDMDSFFAGSEADEWKRIGKDLNNFLDRVVEQSGHPMSHTLTQQLKQLGYIQ